MQKGYPEKLQYLFHHFILQARLQRTFAQALRLWYSTNLTKLEQIRPTMGKLAPQIWCSIILEYSSKYINISIFNQLDYSSLGLLLNFLC